MDAGDLSSAPGGHGVATWSSSSWRSSATSWLDEQLDALGERRTGAVEQPHLRPWATVLRAPTTRGTVWLKAPGPGAAFEVALYGVFAGLGREDVLTPLAVDSERRWLLLPDGGRVLADTVPGEQLIGRLCDAVSAYARLQLDLSERAADLLAAGVPDMRPQIMPARLTEALDAVRPYAESGTDAAGKAMFERLRGVEGWFGRECAELARSPVTASLQHGDLHPRNIFAGDPGSSPVFFDWGDSTVAHPFTSMLVALRVVRQLASSGDDGPEVVRVRDAYLEPFTCLAPHTELVASLERACRIGKVARCLTWAAALSGLPADEIADDADMPFGWLTLLLDSSYLGDLHAD